MALSLRFKMGTLMVVVYSSQGVVRPWPDGARRMLIPEPGPWQKRCINGSSCHNASHLDLGLRKAPSEGARVSQPKKMDVKVEGTTCRKALRQEKASASKPA